VEPAPGRLLAKPSNIRQGWKGLPRKNRSAYSVDNFLSNVINLGAYPRGVCYRKALGLTPKYQTRLERLAKNKLDSLFCQ
jgi:hypothetical protein